RPLDRRSQLPGDVHTHQRLTPGHDRQNALDASLVARPRQLEIGRSHRVQTLQVHTPQLGHVLVGDGLAYLTEDLGYALLTDAVFGGDGLLGVSEQVSLPDLSVSSTETFVVRLGHGPSSLNCTAFTVQQVITTECDEM